MPNSRRFGKKKPSKSRKSRRFYGVTGGDVRSIGSPHSNYKGVTGGDVRSRGSPHSNYKGVTGGDVRSRGSPHSNYKGIGRFSNRETRERRKRQARLDSEMLEESLRKRLEILKTNPDAKFDPVTDEFILENYM